MGITIGLVANVYNECCALPGWLEAHLSHFDDVRVWHAGPGGNLSDDGTMEIIARWGVPFGIDSIDEGFGAVRTRAIRSSPCDYVMLLDADERFCALNRVLTCCGEATPQAEVDRILSGYDFRNGRMPDWDALAKLGADLSVNVGAPYDQMGHLRDVLEADRPDAVCAIRRHWHGMGMHRPTQNWHTDPDWQMRIVRNHPDIYFDPGTRMHERLVGAQRVSRADMQRGPFFEHYHFFFKKMEPDQRRHDVEIYDAIHRGETPPRQ